MKPKEHQQVLSKGTAVWNKWRDDHPEMRPELHGVDLSQMDLRGVNLSGADLQETNLKDVKLNDANLIGANLIGAKLANAVLHGADLAGASLSGTDFRGADLTQAILRRADLRFANMANAILADSDFSLAKMWNTVFGDNDLSAARGLDTVEHIGPSTIGVATLFKSKGKIPQSFLRGCDVPETLISLLSSLTQSELGIQFYSCFISYSTKDEEFARRLHGRMRDAHLRVWFAPEEMKGGAKLHEQIGEAIRVYDKLLIVLSEASLQSEWVMTELRKARNAERKSGKRKLFPVRLVNFETLREWGCFDADSGRDLAVELREYFIPDFSNWKDQDSFEAAFARLLKDLRADSDSG
jgi:uncharacterized protein YjbI with pentapeptide repeats